MGKLKLHIDPSGQYYYFKKHIIEHIKHHDPEGFIYILPVNRAVRYFQKQLTTYTETGALLQAQIHTYSSLTRYIYRKLPDPQKVITNSIRLVFIELILRKNATKLDYFKSKRLISRGLVSKIERMLAEFCEFGYKSEDFIMAPLQAEDKYNDFQRILTLLYQKYSDQLIDEPTLMLNAIHRLDGDWFTKIFPEVKNVYINGYGIYTPPMLKFIAKVKQWCDIDIKLDHNVHNQALFKHTSNAYDALTKIADEVYEQRSHEDVFYHFLFTTIDTLAAEEKSKNEIYIQKTKDRKEEVAYIAATIKRIHQQDKIPLHKIGITFPDMELYVPLIRMIFKEYEIPYNLSTGFPLAQAPLILCFLKVLKVIISEFASNELYYLLASPFLKLDAPVDMGAFKYMTGQLRIKHLLGNWDEKLRSFILYHERKEDIDSENEKTVFLIKCKTVLENLPLLLEKLKTLPKIQTVQQFRSHYLKLLADLGLSRWYENDIGYLARAEREKEFRAFNKFIKLFDQLIWVLQYIHGDKSLPLSEYYHYLMLVLADATYNLREWSQYGIQILPRLEIQSADLTILFVGGLVEGNFPRHFTRDIFFDDAERQMMGLNASEDLLAQDRFLFYQLLSSQTQKIILSYPAFENETTLLPSTFLGNLQDVCQVYAADTEINKKDLLSKNNLLQLIAGEIKSGLDEKGADLFEGGMLLHHKEAIQFWLHGIDIMYDKYSRSKTTSYEGNLENNIQIRDYLRIKSKKPISVSALESYAFCPMQYFLQRILKLEEEEEVEFVASALEKGLLVHRILFRFYSHLKEIGKQAQPWLYKSKLEEIAREEFDRMPYQGMFWILEQENYFGTAERIGLWERFLQFEQDEITRTAFEPCYFEVAFGRAGNGAEKDVISTGLPVTIKKFGREIALTGKIDRIDIDADGNLMVLDYKTGSSIDTMSVKNIFSGDSLQLPVYLEMIQGHLRKKGYNTIPVAGTLYQVRDGDNCRRKIVFADNEKKNDLLLKGPGRLPNKDFSVDGEKLSFAQMIDHSLKFVFTYAESLSKGVFTHTHYPKNVRCAQYCSFNKICRKDIAKLLAQKN